MTLLDAVLFIPSRLLGLALGATLFPIRAVVLTVLTLTYNYGSKAINIATKPFNILLNSLRSGTLLGLLSTIIGGTIAFALGLAALAIGLPFGLVNFAINAVFNIISSVFEGIEAGLQGGITGFWNAFITFESPFKTNEELVGTASDLDFAEGQFPNSDTQNRDVTRTQTTRPTQIRQGRETRATIAPIVTAQTPQNFNKAPGFFHTFSNNDVPGNPVTEDKQNFNH